MKTTRKVDKREQHVRKKLTAAILMLLISCIMTVTSTYAWFTLSTAPEVTGIQTTIGGNGNLEIALANETTWERGSAYEYEEYDAIQGDKDVNTSYGNLVDLGQTISATNLKNKYGLDEIVLYPAALNRDGDKVSSDRSLLSFPEYNSDGRITGLSSNTMSGVYTGNGFATTGNGVRVVGASSSVSERQFAYNKALDNIMSYAEKTENAVEQAISDHGDHLVNVAIQYATNATSYKAEDLDGIKELISAVLGDDENPSVSNIEMAVMSIVKATVASKAFQSEDKLSDEYFVEIIDTINEMSYEDNLDITMKDGSTTEVESIVVTLGTYSENVTDSLKTIVEKYISIVNKLNLAKTAANEAVLSADGTYTETEIKKPLAHLMDMGSSNVTVAGKNIDWIKANESEAANLFLDSFTQNGGLTVSLGEGSSVFYEIAEVVGDISSKVIVDITYGMTLKDKTIFIKAEPDSTPLLEVAESAVKVLGEPEKVDNTATDKIDDIYAFALDFFIRTNASTSKLLLQIDPVQRIYEESTNSDTMGNGSTMTFTSTSMNEKEMVELLEHVRIMFISADDETDKEILAEGRLDVRYTPVTNEETQEVTWTDKKYNVVGEKIIADIRLYDTATSTFNDVDTSQAIMDLNKGQQHKITVLVYLDGTTITNADVSSFATSMTGTMNLQFASDADLKAMDYSGLKSPGGEEVDPDDSDEPQVTQTLATPTFSYADGTLTFNKVENATSYTYSVDGGEATEITFEEGVATATVSVTLNDGQKVTYTASAEGYVSSSSEYTHTVVTGG